MSSHAVKAPPVPASRYWSLHQRVPKTWVPLRQLDAAEVAGVWQALGDEPTFRLEGGLPLPGWNMLELACQHSVVGAMASFSWDAGGEWVTVELPLVPGKVTKRLVHFPVGVKQMEFCPINARGTFVITHFRFVWVPPPFAYDRLLRRLASKHPLYQSMPRPEVMRKIKLQAREEKRRWQDLALEEYDSTFISLCSKRNYRQWIERVEARRHRVEVEKQAGQALALGVLIAAVESATVEEIDATLESLRQQSAEGWHAVVLLMRGASERLRSRLTKLSENEPRLTLLGEQEAGCLASIRVAFTASAREWIVAMQPGDRLATDAMRRLSLTIQRQPDATLLFSDEDRLDSHGVRHSPRFKPAALNPDLLLSQPYLGRAVFVRREIWDALVRDEGAFRLPALESYVHDLALLFMESQGKQAVELSVHVPQVLYHVQERPAAFSDGKDGWEKAVRRYLQGQGYEAALEPGLLPDTVRVRWPIPDSPPLVSLLVPTRDGVEILKPCVDAILAHTEYPNFELLLLDNQSRCRETLAYMEEVVRRDSRVRLLRWDHPFNYSGINNFGARHARGEILGLINNDVEPMNGDWLSEMVGHACRPEIGCVGAKLYYPNDTVQHGGVILGLGGVAGHAHRYFQRDEDGFCGRLKVVQNLSAVTAACLLLRKEIYEQVGGLNESDLPVALNDVDLCLKVREAGYRNLWTPYAELYHHESVSRGTDDTPEKQARARREAEYMRERWGRLLDNDPAYNPNLSLVYEDFSLR